MENILTEKTMETFQTLKTARDIAPAIAKLMDHYIDEENMTAREATIKVSQSFGIHILDIPVLCMWAFQEPSIVTVTIEYCVPGEDIGSHLSYTHKNKQETPRILLDDIEFINIFVDERGFLISFIDSDGSKSEINHKADETIKPKSITY